MPEKTEKEKVNFFFNYLGFLFTYCFILYASQFILLFRKRIKSPGEVNKFGGDRLGRAIDEFVKRSLNICSVAKENKGLTIEGEKLRNILFN